MVQMLIVGLVWLSLTAALCLMIGRALRTADQHEEQRAQERAVEATQAEMIGRALGGATDASWFAPDLTHPLDDDELVRWGELWRWEDELRRGVDEWRGEPGARPDPPDDPSRPGPDGSD